MASVYICVHRKEAISKVFTSDDYVFVLKMERNDDRLLSRFAAIAEILGDRYTFDTMESDE